MGNIYNDFDIIRAIFLTAVICFSIVAILMASPVRKCEVELKRNQYCHWVVKPWEPIDDK